MFRAESSLIHEENVIKLVKFTPKMLNVYMDIAQYGSSETARIAATNALATIVGYLQPNARPGERTGPLALPESTGETEVSAPNDTRSRRQQLMDKLLDEQEARRG